MNVTGPALLTANDIALAYGHQRLLEAVTLLVAPGEKVGLLGRNGCGKTSLLRILAGHQRADAGDVARRRGLRVGCLPQEFELDDSLTVRQNIEAGAADLIGWLRRYEAGQGTDRELAALLNTLLPICLGERPLDEGTVKLGKRVAFNYIDQARMQLNGTGTVLEEISDGNETVLFGEQRLSARSYPRMKAWRHGVSVCFLVDLAPVAGNMRHSVCEFIIESELWQ
jgi:ATPase subunit of ABC transporter with duplicated ATPase domains